MTNETNGTVTEEGRAALERLAQRSASERAVALSALSNLQLLAVAEEVAVNARLSSLRSLVNAELTTR